MVNKSTKFDEETQNNLVSIAFTSLFSCVSKFDEETQNGLVCIMLTSLFPYKSLVTLTFDRQNQ